MSLFALTLFVNAQMVPRTVLLEHFTQASCGPCAAYNPGIETILNTAGNEDKIVAVKYQTSWPGVDPMNAHNPTDVADRRGLYGVSGVPNSVLDGNYYNGGPTGWNQSSLDSRVGVLSPFTVDVKAIYGPDSTTLDVEVKIKAAVAVTGNMVAQIAIVEKHIGFASPPGSNGEKDFHDVMKKLLPSSNGTALSANWAAGDSIVIMESWTHSNVYDVSELKAVAWVQNTSTKEVLQAKGEDFKSNIAPLSNFKASHIYVSAGTTIDFRDRSAYYPTGWTWDFDASNKGGVSPKTSTLKNPSSTYNNLGDYDVELTTVNNYGTHSATKAAYIHVIECQDIGIDIQMDNYAGTVSWEVTNDTSGEVLVSGSGYPNVNGGQLISESLCLGQGCYTLRMHDAAGNGICCVSGNGNYTITNKSQANTVLATGGQFAFEDSVQFCVSTAIIAPVADFSSNKSSICEHNLIEFTDESTNNPTAWLWTFPGGDPSTSTLKNPIVNYPVDGIYAVTFKAFNNVGDNTVTKNSFITVDNGPTVNAGSDIDVCTNNAGTINLSGSVTLATGVVWSTSINANIASPTSLNTTYTPTQGDFNKGFTTITLSSTGNGSCIAATDKIIINYTAIPEVDAGLDITICETDTAAVLTGLVIGSTGGAWTGGNGSFIDASATSTNYIIDPADLSAGNVTLTLTSTGNGICNAVTDDIKITINDSPEIDAGVDQGLCPGSNAILSATFSGSTSVQWYTNGTGSFTPSASLPSPIYIPSSDDLLLDSLTLTVLTTGNGVCEGSLDTLVLKIECEGINDMLNDKFNAYPNPAANTIYLDSKGVEVISVNLINTIGETVKTFNVNTNSEKITLPISNVTNGTYILNIFTKQGIAHKPITIQK